MEPSDASLQLSGLLVQLLDKTTVLLFVRLQCAQFPETSAGSGRHLAGAL